MKINNFPKLLFIPLLLISPFVFSSTAQTLSNNEGKNFEDETPRVQLKKAENQERRCELATQKIADKLTRYRATEKRYQGVYTGLGNKLQNLVNRLKADGYEGENVEALEADITKLNGLAEKLRLSYSGYTNKLDELKMKSCEDSDTNFVSSLKLTREELTGTRAVIQEIKDFYLNEVKPHIAAMREQMREQKLNQQQETDTENENEKE